MAIVRLHMNAAQKRLASRWILATTTVVIVLLSAQWMLEVWDYLRWPAWVLLVIAAVFSRKSIPTWNERWDRINETAQRHPFVRVWLAVYGLLLATGVFWVLKTNLDVIDNFGMAFFLLLFIGLLAPFIIADQVDRYRALGAQSNPTVDSDARERRARGSP